MNAMKRLTLLFFVLTIFLSNIPPVQAATANSPSLGDIQIFPKDNIWNTPVDNLPVDAKSDIYIDDLITDTAPYGNLRHYIRTAIPYNVVNSTQSHQYITRFGSLAYSDNVSYPIPDDPLFEQGCSDNHMEIIDEDETVLYELYAAEKMADGSWHAGSGAVWDLKKNLFRKKTPHPCGQRMKQGFRSFPDSSGTMRSVQDISIIHCAFQSPHCKIPGSGLPVRLLHFPVQMIPYIPRQDRDSG